MARLFFTICMTAALLTGVTAFLPQTAWAEPAKIRVGVEYKAPPYQFINESGQVDGLNIDMMNSIGERENLEISYVLFDTNEAAIHALLNDEIDAVLGVLPQDKPEKSTVLTSYISSGTISLIAENSRAKKMMGSDDDEKKFTTAFELGTMSFSQILQLDTSYTVVEGDQMQLFDCLISGEVDCVAGVKESLLYQIKREPDLQKSFTVINDNMESVKYYILLRDDEPMLYSKLNRSIHQLRNSKAYDSIIGTWVTDEALEKAENRIRNLFAVISLLIIIAGVALFSVNMWNRKLKVVVKEQTEEIRKQMYWLEENSRLRKLLITQFPNSIVILNKEGRVMLMNPRAETVAGVKDIDWEAPEAEPVHVENLKIFGKLWSETTAERNQDMEGSAICAVTLPDNRKKRFRYQYYRLNDNEDTVLLMEDVTKEESRRNAIAEGEKNRMLNQIIAGLAHEIKNPLMSIQAFAAIIKESGQDKEFQESFAQYVPQEVNRIKRLIDALINYAKPADMTKESVDVRKLTDECVYLVSASARNKAIKISCVNEIDAQILVNRDQIKQAIVNLLINGIESVAARMENETDRRAGEVALTVSREDDVICITVRDNGRGMREEEIQNCTALFYTTKKTGTGIGLPLTKQYITNNGGEMRVESEVNLFAEISMRFKEEKA